MLNCKNDRRCLRNVRCFNLKKPCLENASHKVLRPVNYNTYFLGSSRASVITEQLIQVWKCGPIFEGIPVILCHKGTILPIL